MSEKSQPGESTESLIRRYQAGDHQALEHLLDRYLLPLRRWAAGRLPVFARTLLETDDLVQNTMLRTLNRVQVFEPQHSGAFQAYLRTGILNAIRDEVRRFEARNKTESGLDEIYDPRPSPLEEALGQDALARYERAFSELSPSDQALVVSRIELGQDYPEIAGNLGKPSPNAARMAVSRALLKLAKGMAS